MITRADIGSLVRDEEGRVGILRDVIPDYEETSDPPCQHRTRPMAFLWPQEGGREWAVPPDTVRRVKRP
ncbi:hypothetical protein H3146_18690 [Streptomyces sp. OF3]|uniref:PRC-barrel domain containing protein n=1 Tax=Streptomyces alkaliterrae TaxID=2213162 RepID=A0A7W3WN27_9ACTN|nr:hypothetical protein [Streptomyces alkaliterrae]MBB1255367.1 hypothetical protein [Streptomyces alkaliterrae]